MTPTDPNQKLDCPIFFESYTMTRRNKIFKYYDSYIKRMVLSQFQDNEIWSMLGDLLSVKIDDTHSCISEWYLIDVYQICTIRLNSCMQNAQIIDMQLPLEFICHF